MATIRGIVVVLPSTDSLCKQIGQISRNEDYQFTLYLYFSYSVNFIYATAASILANPQKSCCKKNTISKQEMGISGMNT